MKTLFYFLIIIVLAQGCNTTAKESRTDSRLILIDVTDYFPEQELDSDAIYRNLPVLTTDPWRGAFVRFVEISNFRQSPSVSIYIEPEYSFAGNDLERKNKIQNFKKELRTAIEHFRDMKKGLHGSAIFNVVFRQLNAIGASNYQTKECALLSDLRETLLFDSYDSAVLNNFQHNPEQFYNLLDSACPLKNSIASVRIHLIHQTVNQKDDNAYFILSSLLKSYLMERKNASVTIETNLE